MPLPSLLLPKPIICIHSLVFEPMVRMGRVHLAPVYGGVSHAPIVRVHVNTRPQAALEASLSALLHLLPQFLVLLNRYDKNKGKGSSLYDKGTDIIR